MSSLPTVVTLRDNNYSPSWLFVSWVARLSNEEGRPDPGTIDHETASEIAELLSGLGMEAEEASVIGYLAAHGEGRSASIEDVCKLRQPQVSQATSALEARGWVETDREKTPGKGRPVNVYSLGPSIEDIVEEVTARRREEVNRELARIERLRQLIRAPATERESPTQGAVRPEHHEGQG